MHITCGFTGRDEARRDTCAREESTKTSGSGGCDGNTLEAVRDLVQNTASINI